MRTLTDSFAPPYSVQGFAVARLGREPGLRVVVTSQHYLYYPSQVALLSPKGEVLREYWHAGGLARLLIADSGPGGGSRIVLAGVNNATKSATLVVLDPDTMAGAGREEKPSYQLQGFRPGREVARLLFPRSCMNVLLEPFVTVGSVWREKDEIVLDVAHRIDPQGASVYYHFNNDLSLKSMTVGSSFEQFHEQLFATHVLGHALSSTEADALRNITYLMPSRGATK